MSKIRRYTKSLSSGINITRAKLDQLILDFLTQYEATMETDFDPNSEEWRQIFSRALSAHIWHRLNPPKKETNCA